MSIISNFGSRKFNFAIFITKKRSSSDNSVCEGFFGSLKKDFFYNRDLKNVTIENFIKHLNETQS